MNRSLINIKEIFLSKTPKEAQQALAESKFQRKEMQARDGASAMAEYRAAQVAERKKTAKLREQRLAKEAAEKSAAEHARPGKSANKPEGGAKKKR